MNPRIDVVWFEGFGDHEYIEASRQTYDSLAEAVAAVSDQIGPEELIEALRGTQVDISWVTDDRGFMFALEGKGEHDA